MKNRKIWVVSMALAWLGTLPGCRLAKPLVAEAHAPARGNDSFQKSLSQGAVQLRPQSYRAASTLRLGAKPIVSSTLDEASGAWARVLFDTRLSERAPADELKAFGLRLIAKYEDDLQFPPTEAAEGTVYQASPETLILSFNRVYRGVMVKGAFLRFYFARQKDGSLRLSEIINNSYGPIKVSHAKVSVPSDASMIAATGLKATEISEKALVIQPRLDESGRYQFSYASEYKLTEDSATPAEKETFTVTMDHETGQLVEVYSNRSHEQQTLTVEIFPRSYVFNDAVFKALPFAQVTDGMSKHMTDALGSVQVLGKQITVQLASEKSASAVVDVARSSSEWASFDSTVGADGKTSFKLNTVNPAAVNAFVASQKTVDFISKYLSVAEFPLLGKPLLTVVNRKDDVCNAFYDHTTDGESIHFFAQGLDPLGRTCANTALVTDFVYHEWGHALDDFMGPRSKAKGVIGITEAAYSEGLGDVLAAYMLRSPTLGAGWILGDRKEMRNLQNTRQHPPANTAESEKHEAGLIVAGAFWDMYTNLSALYGEEKGADLAARLFFKHIAISERYLDAYAAVLRVDDDDNNPATRSPNHCAITRAFAAHNISGSEKVAADCIDTDTSLNLRVDLDEGDGKLSLLASAYGASKIVACPGLVKACNREMDGFRELAFQEADDALTRKGDRRFYTATGSFDVKANPVYTFFSLDSRSSVVGVKNLKFKIRDNSTSSTATVKP